MNPTSSHAAPGPGPTLGIVANPVSARDIRRVVANAGNLQITDRVNILLRLLQAARAAGVERALLMPDRGGIRALLERQLRRGDHGLPLLQWLDFEPSSSVDDSFEATRRLLAAGVSAIVVLGGDGTHRAVVRELVAHGGERIVPVAGLSTGTNNAFPEMREPTITGLAVGLYAAGRLHAAQALVANKLLEVEITRPGSDRPAQHDIAIVDAVITHDRSVGARALWKTGSLAEVYLAFAEPEAIGLSSVGGLLQPVSRREPRGLAVQLARPAPDALDEPDPAAADASQSPPPAPPALVLHAPIAPGLVLPVPVAQWQALEPDQPHSVSLAAGTVALDGERELGFEPGDRVTVTLRTEAFLTLDVAQCMAAAAREGLMRALPQP